MTHSTYIGLGKITERAEPTCHSKAKLISRMHSEKRSHQFPGAPSNGA